MQDQMIQEEHLAALDMSEGAMGQVSNEPCEHPLVIVTHGHFQCQQCMTVLTHDEAMSLDR